MSKNINAALASSIANRTTTLATCFKLVLKAGVSTQAGASALYFTDHDQDLVFSAVTYKAANSYQRSATQTPEGMQVPSQELTGIVITSVLTEADLREGCLDDAVIETFLVDWTNPNQGRVMLRKGWLGEMTVQDDLYRAELRGMTYKLSQNIVEKCSQTCRYTFGDLRCTASVAIVTAQVASVLTNNVFDATSTGSTVFSSTVDRYAGGLVTWKSGANLGRKMEVRKWNGTARLELFLKMSDNITVGDVFQVTAGCNKTVSSSLGCESHGNILNYGGEPHVRGDASFMYVKTNPAV